MAAQKCTAEIAWRGDPRVRRFQEEMARRRSEEARRIGARITALREQHHLTQEAAAAKLKIAYRTYQSWEQGTSVPRWPMREKLAKFYKVSVEEINGPPALDDERLERIEQKLDVLRLMLTLVAAGQAIDVPNGAIQQAQAELAEADPPIAA